MTYDLEKYRVKREKVLGVRKRGLSFGAAAALVASVIILGLGGIGLPRAVDYFSTRNLDDAIYKLADTGAWPAGVVKEVGAMHGVRTVVADNHDTRLVVTFDRNMVDIAKLEAIFGRDGLQAELLNRMSHRHRRTILSKEAKLETP